MKKHLRKIILLIIITYGTACSGSTSDNVETQTIRIDFKNDVSINDTDFIDSVQLVNLECGIVIGDVDRVIRSDEYIYVLDRWQTQTVLIFDRSGNFVNSISNRGEGPNEYLQLWDILINPDNGSLNLISRMDKKMLRYSSDGSRLLSVESLPEIFSCFFKTQTGYIGYAGNYRNSPDESKNVLVLSNDLEIESSFFDIDPTWESKDYGSRYVFSSFNNTVHYVKLMDFTIYAFDGEKMSAPYFFDLGKLAWPEEVKEFDRVEELLEKDRNRYIHSIKYFQETENKLIINVIYGGQNLLGIYDKRTKKSIVSQTDAFIGDYLVPSGKIIGFGRNEIYLLVEAENMKRISTGRNDYVDFESKYPAQVKKLRADFPVIEEDGNPFLVIYYLK
jgi:hypothetical protein